MKQYCNKTCIPKLKYFGITDSMILSKETDLDGNLVTFNINKCHPNLPPVTIQGGSLMYLKNNEYVNFDSSSYKNVYVKVYNDNINGNSSTYSISVEPLDCSKEMIISNIHLNSPKDKVIYDFSIDNSIKIKLSLPISDDISSLMNDFFLEIDDGSSNDYNARNMCQKSLYFLLYKEDIKSFLVDSYHKNSINSIFFNDNIAKKPLFSVSGGSLKYLDSDGSYKNFKDEEYQNIDLQLYQLKDLLYYQYKNYNEFYALRIFPKDNSKPMILGDQTIYPFQNYELKNVSEAGEIDVMPIPNYLSVLLN